MTQDSTIPIPPRFRALKRIAIAAGLFLLFVAGVRWWAGAEAERRYHAVFESLRAAGEPLEPEDFALPPIPDDRNAALILQRAVASMPKPAKEALESRDITADPGLCVTRPDAVRAMLEANTEALRLVRDTRGMQANWGTDYLAPDSKSPRLAPYSELIRYLSVAALFNHAMGDDRKAIEYARDLLAMAGHLNAHRGSLIANLVAIQASDGCVDMVEIILTDWSVATHAPQPMEVQVTRHQWVAMIADLLDDESLLAGTVWAVQGDRSFMLRLVDRTRDSAADLLAGRTSPLDKLIYAIYRPILDAELENVALHYNTLVRAVSQDDWPSTARLWPWVPALNESVLYSYAHWLSAWTLPNLYAPFQHARSDIARRRLAAAGIAIRLYQLDRGTMPQSLTELVPGYLPYVPLDPFSANKQPIIYVNDESGTRVELRNGVSFSVTAKQSVARVPGDGVATPSTQSVEQGDDVEDQDGQRDDQQRADDQP